MTRKHHLLDEDDVRVRPGRGKSRPRSKDRPEHAEARSGTVMTVDRGRFTVELDDGTDMYAIKARELGRKGIVVGDHVDIVGDVSGDTDTQGRIVRRDERSSTLRRTADDDDPVERVVVANANQLAVVTSTVDPAPRTGLIDRAIVAALDAGIEPHARGDQDRPQAARRAARALRSPRPAAVHHHRQAGARRASTGRWTARPPSSSATPASASPRWSTTSFRRRSVSSGTSTP